jgi:hypothetical protein
MMKFLRFALVNHNNITNSMNWFSPAAYSPGSHSFLGYPWEIYRSGSILPNNTRAITINTKGGGLAGYYSYSVVIPSYDLAIFMVVGGDLLALNTIFDIVMSPVVQAAEKVAQNELANTYTGHFTTTAATKPTLNETQNANLNSSITIAQSDGQSLFIKSWISSSTDALGAFTQVTARQAGLPASDIYFQFIPTFETRDRGDGTVGEVWRFINVLRDNRQSLSALTILNDYCVGNIDPLKYAQMPLNEVIFWKRHQATRIDEVELTALRLSLFRTE